jgi:hypothetical protein
MTELYPGGPAMGAVSGVTASTVADRYTSAITVSGIDASMVRWMERLFEVSRYGISLRTGTTATSGYADGDLISA